MAQNYLQPGNQVTITNSTGTAVVSGEPFAVNDLVVVALGDIANGAAGTCGLEGVYSLPKTNPLVINQGDKVYFSTSTKKVTKTNTDKVCGVCVKAALSADATVEVKLICF